MNSVADLSDSLLDTAFAVSYDANDTIATQFYGAEIRERIIGVRGFLEGIFSTTSRFPKFEARSGGFTQSGAARESVAAAADNVATSAGNALKIGGGVIAVAVVAGVFLYFVVTKGKR